MQIILNLLFGESSSLYKELYQDGNLFSSPSLSYEFTDSYAHVLISESANDPEMLYTKFKNKVKEFKESKLDENNFDRIKKMIYGEYIKEYNDVTEISRMFLSDFMKGIDSFDYLEEIDGVDIDFVSQVLKQYFVDDKMVLSVVYW